MKITLPVFLAHFPIGIVFGVLFVNLGLPWFYAPLMSLLVYAGAVQFLALGIIAVHGSYLNILLATAFVALRNAFYGISVFDQYRTSIAKKSYLIFGLVDATYSMVTAEPDKKTGFYLGITALNHLYWVGGTFVGALFGNIVPTIPGLEFALTAFFTVLTVDALLAAKSIKPLIVAGIAAAIAFLIAPSQMLFVAILCSVAWFAFEKEEVAA